MEMSRLPTGGDNTQAGQAKCGEQDGSDSTASPVSFRMYEVIKFELISLVVNAMNT